MYAAGFAVGVLLIGVYLALMVGIYILCQFGLYRMAKHAGIPGAWLAFVPVAGGYVLGLLAERAVYTFTGRQRRLALWNVLLPGIAVGGAVLMGVAAVVSPRSWGTLTLLSLLLILGSIAGFAVFCYSLYYVFKDYAPDNTVLFTVLGIFLGIYWIFFLVVMNTVPVSVTGFGAYLYGRPKYDKDHRWPRNPPDQPGYGGGYGGYGGYGGPGGPGYPGGQSSPYTTRPEDYRSRQDYPPQGGAPQGGQYPPPGGFGGLGGGYDPAHPGYYPQQPRQSQQPQQPQPDQWGGYREPQPGPGEKKNGEE